MTELLDGYKPDIKPARNANTPINITFHFELHRIEGLVRENLLLGLREKLEVFNANKNLLLFTATKMH